MNQNSSENRNSDTIALLQECSAGSKMATDSMEQVKSYVRSAGLNNLLHEYNEKHIKIGERISNILHREGIQDKDPSLMAKAFSKAQSAVKLTMDSGEKEAAGILMDGCNMGVKSLSEYLNKYSAADGQAKDICRELRKIEKDMAGELEAYL